jgi:hypothetical protein
MTTAEMMKIDRAIAEVKNEITAWENVRRKFMAEEYLQGIVNAQLNIDRLWKRVYALADRVPNS